jgi:hypothetical protein
MEQQFIKIQLPDVNVQKVVSLISYYLENNALEEKSVPLMLEIRDQLMECLRIGFIESNKHKENGHRPPAILHMTMVLGKIETIWNLIKMSLDDGNITGAANQSLFCTTLSYLANILDMYTPKISDLFKTSKIVDP